MSYNGGKAGAGVYQQIINQIPPHRTYIEAFLGDGAIMRAKHPATNSIGIERDETVVAGRWAAHDVPCLTVICGDARSFLSSYPWQGDEFVYLDPPYLMTTRSSQRNLYGCEFASEEEHAGLLALARSIPVPVGISGYWSELYARELADWRTISFQAVTRSGRLATEWLWMNYPPPLELHDYRYLGSDYRERERIKRRRERWKARLRRLPDQERHALFAAIAEVRAESLAVGGIAGNGGMAGGIAGNDEVRRYAPPDLAVRACTARSGDIVEGHPHSSGSCGFDPHQAHNHETN